MYQALLVMFLLVAISLVTLIILQQGKGADTGVSFGEGVSGTLFGSSASGNLMTRMTAVFAMIFFVLSLILGKLGSNRQKSSQWDNLTQDHQANKVLAEVRTKTDNDIPQ